MNNLWSKNRILKITVILLVVFFISLAIILKLTDYSYLKGYENKTQPNTTYSSSDWIGFYGSLGGGLFGAMIAIFGVYITIEYNRKETENILNNDRAINEELIQENRALNDEVSRKSILPVIAINKLLSKYEGNFLASLIAETIPDEDASESNSLIPIENDMQYKEFEFESLFFSLYGNMINISSELTQEQLMNIKNNWKRGLQPGNGQVGVPNFSYIPCLVTNCGNGAAINTTFSLKKENVDDNEGIISEPVNLKKDANFRLGFYCNLSEEIFGNYSLKIEYFDIHGEKYSQNHLICINNETSTITSKVNQIHQTV
jgi:hypothetical protein